MANEVTDPTDWLDTPLAPLSGIEAAFRCQVCKELMESPMITSCAHTFCSICIRRCLTSEGRCPLCRASDQSNKLRKNTAIEEAITAFRSARSYFLQFGREAAEQKKAGATTAEPRSRNKRSLEDAELTMNGDSNPRKTRASARRSGSKREPTPVVVDDSEEDSEFEEAEEVPNDGLAACPICGKRMPEERVFGHLDTHNELAQANKGSSQNFGLGQMKSLPNRTPALEPLPGLNYSLLNETALRRKIASMGIPSGGNKPLLQRRHTEWVNIWNANCDSRRPRSKRELLRDLDIWEKSQNQPQTAPAAGSIMNKDFDHQSWAVSHGTDFKDLIARARENAMKKKEAKDEHEKSDRAASNEVTRSGTSTRNPAAEKEGGSHGTPMQRQVDDIPPT